MSLLLALTGGTVAPPAPPPSVANMGGSSVPLYLFRRPMAEVAKPRKPRRRRLADALLVARAV